MQKIIIAVTGASGAIYAQQLLHQLTTYGTLVSHVGVVMSTNAKSVWQTELGNSDFNNMPFNFYEPHDFNAPFASGSAQYGTMVVIPCSMGTLGRIATGVSNCLVTRAADVILKERRKLICVVRETPYNLIHIKNMETITLAGGIICPATPSYYHVPTTVTEVAETVTHRIVDLMGLPVATKRWNS